MAPLRLAAQEGPRAVLVTLDGVRWQEVFGGVQADRLAEQSESTQKAFEERFGGTSEEARRTRLMPFFWSEIAQRGQLLGDPRQDSVFDVANQRIFSYPGYNEILVGRPDSRIISNAKIPNRNVTVLEWLLKERGYAPGSVAAFTSWDVFPSILNTERSGIYTNAGWQELEIEGHKHPAAVDLFNRTMLTTSREWAGVRFDSFTFEGALEYLRTKTPRVLFLALGEPDDWAHAGRYDRYLEAIHRNDQQIARLWAFLQEHPAYKGKTSLVITTDHGRGTTKDTWTGHGADIEGAEQAWVALLGPGIEAKGLVRGVRGTSSQIAATLALLLGENYHESVADVAPPLALGGR